MDCKKNGLVMPGADVTPLFPLKYPPNYYTKG